MGSKIFIWKNLADWRGAIEEIIPQEISKELIEEIRANRENFKYTDDLSCFKGTYLKFGDYSLLEDAFVTYFPARFEFVRMYHCCRPSDTGSYYEKGILPLDSHEAEEKFKSLFIGNPRFPAVTESLIDEAISSMAGSCSRHGHVYFGIDDRFLVRYCSPYLAYGSEYVQCLVAYLERTLGCHAKSELEKMGTPSVFKVNMPVGQLSSGELMELARRALPAWAFAIAHDKNEAGIGDFSIEIEHGLPPQFIAGHYHPVLHRDRVT